MTRKNIPGTSPFEPIIGFSRMPSASTTTSMSPAPARWVRTAIEVAEQTEQCLTLIATALKNAGSSMEQVYRTRMYLTRAEDWEAVGRVHGKFFGLVRPAATMVVVAALLNPGWRIEIEADALIPD